MLYLYSPIKSYDDETVAFVLTALLAGNLSAQEYAFKVLINKGKNDIKDGNNWTPIKVGARLLSDDELAAFIERHGLNDR